MQQIRKGYPLVPLENYQWQDFAINDNPQKSQMPQALKQTKAMIQVLAELPGFRNAREDKAEDTKHIVKILELRTDKPIGF